tara:strand:- start:3437 stop:3931 length:495 start_codon:yes stop_codon:yes gene_type:complete
MSIRVKKNYLIYKNKEFPCAIGKNGFALNKKEGDGCTPIGTFHIENILYRYDKISNVQCLIKTDVIKKNDGWCDEVSHFNYNQMIKFPFKDSAEKLYREDDLYNIVCILNYNRNPIIPGAGSAIFLHIAKEDFSPTEGCVALKEKDLLFILNHINNNEEIVIKP